MAQTWFDTYLQSKEYTSLSLDDKIKMLQDRIDQTTENLKQYPEAMDFRIPASKELNKLKAQRLTITSSDTQTDVNTKAGTAGQDAIQTENLLARNVGQEIQGRIARNTQQAQEAAASVNILSEATRGRQAAKAGNAGYGMSSGTAGALADASSVKSAEDLAAIEGYRIGRQNLLMGQGSAAAKAAESLTGTIDTTTKDWQAKSVLALGDVTGTHEKNVDRVVNTFGYTGFVDTPEVKASATAVDTTLKTWSLESYMDVLNSLTSRSANKSTWDQMLLDQSAAPENPYSSYGQSLAPLTPTAGMDTNLLAAAAGTPDSVYRNKSGRLI